MTKIIDLGTVSEETKGIEFGPDPFDSSSSKLVPVDATYDEVL